MAGKFAASAKARARAQAAMVRAEAYIVRAQAAMVRANALRVRAQAASAKARARAQAAEASRVRAGRICVYIELGEHAEMLEVALTDTIKKVRVRATRLIKKVGGQLLENGRTLSDHHIQHLDTLVLWHAWPEATRVRAGKGRARRRREAAREAERLQQGGSPKQPRWEDEMPLADCLTAEEEEEDEEEEEEEEEEDWSEE